MKLTLVSSLLLTVLACGCQVNFDGKKLDVIPTLTLADVDGRLGDALTLSPSGLTADAIIRSCTISPALPAGLSLDSSTCEISGTPTEGIKETNYTVTASNNAGEVSATFKLRVIHFRGEPVTGFGDADGRVFFDMRADGNVSGTLYKDWARRVTLQADGKILVTGETSAPVGNPTDGYVARLNTDGTLDTTFASGGRFFFNTAFNAREYFYDVKVHNNKIYVFGSSRTNGTAASARSHILRLNADGTLDNTFGTAGSVVMFTANESSFIIRAIILDDGKMLIQGYNGTPTRHWFVAKLNADGSFDNTFGTAGVFKLNSANTNAACDMKIDAEGNIFAVVNVGASTDYKTTVFKLTSAGVLDTNFATAGVYTSPETVRTYPADLHLVNGQLVLLAYIEAAPIWHKYVQKFNTTTGALDSGWGNSGTLTFSSQTEFVDSYLNSSVVMHDQMILSGGRDNGFALVSLDLNSGEISQKFATNGVYVSDQTNATQQINHLVINPATKELIGAGHADANAANQLLHVIKFK